MPFEPPTQRRQCGIAYPAPLQLTESAVEMIDALSSNGAAVRRRYRATELLRLATRLPFTGQFQWADLKQDTQACISTVFLAPALRWISSKTGPFADLPDTPNISICDDFDSSKRIVLVN